MASLQAFPSLTEHEFVDACMALEARSADKLDDTDWLSVHWTGKELLIKQKRRSHSSTGADSDNDKEEECQDLMEDLCHNDTVWIFPRIIFLELTEPSCRKTTTSLNP
jgi:hypothetical protein